jgi:hypothetical protein
MGALLAMMKRARLAAMLAGAALGVAGCDTLSAMAPGGGATTKRISLDQLGQPRLRASLERRGTSALMHVTGRNGDVVTWETPQRISVSLADGVLVATRGLGHDLMSVEVREARAALKGALPAGADYPRFYGYLDGEHRTTYCSFLCHVVVPERDVVETTGDGRLITRITERCSDPDFSFSNVYWRADDGELVRSRQWIGPELGHIRLERVSG